PGGFFTGFAISGGAFYPASGPFPVSYRGNYFFADYLSQWIGRLDPANGNAAYVFASIGGNPVDLMVAQDGALYVLSHGGSITSSRPSGAPSSALAMASHLSRPCASLPSGTPRPMGMSAAITFHVAFERLSPSSSHATCGRPMKALSGVSSVCRLGPLAPR